MKAEKITGCWNCRYHESGGLKGPKCEQTKSRIMNLDLINPDCPLPDWPETSIDAIENYFGGLRSEFMESNLISFVRSIGVIIKEGK